MAYDEKLAERVRAILRGRRRVAEKKMMGKLAFMVSGSMACSVGEDGLLVRVTEEEREKTLTRAHVSPMKLGARTMRGFVRVATPGLRTKASLTAWIDRSIAAGAKNTARRRPAKATRKKAKRRA